jgi:hypothetical protein
LPEPADTESEAADPQTSYSEPDVVTEEPTDPVANEGAYPEAVLDYTPTKDDLLMELDLFVFTGCFRSAAVAGARPKM